MLDYIYSISPIDGRYSEMTKEVGNYFSEYYLIKNISFLLTVTSS